VNVRFSYWVGILKPFMGMDSGRIIDFQKWRLKIMVVRAWKIGKL